MEQKYYLYRHIRLDTNEVFYVGIGTKYENTYRKYSNEYLRAFTHKNRSKYWSNIIKKSEYEVEILMESDDYEFIKRKEIEFIALYGRKDKNLGTLVNFTDGGQGVTGRIVSEEEKENLRVSTSLFFKGKKQSDEHIRKRFLNMTGENNHMFGKTTPVEIKKKISDSLSGENNYASKRIRHKETGEIYVSIKDAAEKCGYKYSTLRAYLNGSLKNTTKLEYYEEK